MSLHKITVTRTGYDNSVGDWEAEYEITFRAEGNSVQSECDDMILHFVSITPDAGDHGAFSDLAQKGLKEWAQDWLDGDGYDRAVAVAREATHG